MSLEIVILAAGQGTRMRSALPKVLHPIAGNSMLGHVIHTARQLDPQRIHVVIGHGADAVRERLAADDLNFVLQDKQLGTGHAVAQAVPFIESDTVLILYGDVPLIEVETLQRLLKKVAPQQLGLLTVELDDPTGYGRIVRAADGQVTAIVEQKDANEAQRAITEGNTGILAMPFAQLSGWMSRLSNNNAQGEYYLTDVIAMAVSDGLVVATEQAHDAMEVQGANDRKQLSELERHYQLRAGLRLMVSGMRHCLADPEHADDFGQRDIDHRRFHDCRHRAQHHRQNGPPAIARTVAREHRGDFLLAGIGLGTHRELTSVGFSILFRIVAQAGNQRQAHLLARSLPYRPCQ